MKATLCLGAFAVIALLAGCVTFDESPKVSLTDGFDESAGNVPCYIVQTLNATYYLEKEGGGLSSLLDVEGVDWLGFHPEPGSESKGEYRGFPNAVHRQDGSYFHARNTDTDVSTSEVTRVSDDHVQIVFTSGNGKWVGRWDFYPEKCVFSMDRVSPGFKYWILYEGVPGGSFDKTDFWYSSLDSTRRTIDERQNNDLPGVEWIAFGDIESPRMIYLVNATDDANADRYYNMRDEMTVFGFGRAGGEKFLDSPQSFEIGFVDSTDYEIVSWEVVKSKVEGIVF
jgi:hypothetical protein